MPWEPLVSSRSSFWRSGTLNAPRMVAQIECCGVQQREITIVRKSGAFVPLKVSVRSIFQPSFNQYLSSMSLFLKRLGSTMLQMTEHHLRTHHNDTCRRLCRIITVEVIADSSGFWPPHPSGEQRYHFLSSCQHSIVLVFLFTGLTQLLIRGRKGTTENWLNTMFLNLNLKQLAYVLKSPFQHVCHLPHLAIILVNNVVVRSHPVNIPSTR